jgi:tetratricopeptide (TPR) repeat protein
MSTSFLPQAAAEIWRVEGGASAAIVRFADGTAFPEDGSLSYGADLSVSVYFWEMFGLNATFMASLPATDNPALFIQIQALAGPSLCITQGKFSALLTPAVYIYLLPSSLGIAFEIGAGGSLSLEYHITNSLYIYGKFNGAYSFSGSSYSIVPAVGLGFRSGKKKQAAEQPAHTELPQTGAAQSPAQTALTEQLTAAPSTEQLNAPVALAPSSPALTAREYNAQGLEAYNAKNYDAAIAAYTKAYELEPSNAVRKKNLATVYFARGIESYNARNLDAAISDFNESLLLEPDNASVKRYLERAQADKTLAEQSAPATTAPAATAREYNAQGLAAYNTKDYDAAIAAYTKAYELEPNSETRKKNLATAYYARGLISYSVRNLDAAISDFNESLRLVPDNANVKRYLEQAQADKTR